MWKSAEKAPEAAETLGVTSDRLKELGLVDAVIPEPLGGAHRNADEMAERVKQAIDEKLGNLNVLPLPGIRFSSILIRSWCSEIRRSCHADL